MTGEIIPSTNTNQYRANDEELTDIIQQYRDQIIELQRLTGHLEQELIQRLQARQATELQHPTLVVTLDYGTPGCDPAKAQAIAELVPPEDWAKAWHPATTKTVPVKAHLDWRIANGWAKRFGSLVAKAIEAAKLPSAPRVVIKAKE